MPRTHDELSAPADVVLVCVRLMAGDGVCEPVKVNRLKQWAGLVPVPGFG